MRIEEKVFEKRNNGIGRWERGEVGRWDVIKKCYIKRRGSVGR
ncbi:hypothetical protein [Bacillus sp. WP8]|nr:hypothetical protein [Bacillus sp. WP8]